MVSMESNNLDIYSAPNDIGFKVDVYGLQVDIFDSYLIILTKQKTRMNTSNTSTTVCLLLSHPKIVKHIYFTVVLLFWTLELSLQLKFTWITQIAKLRPVGKSFLCLLDLWNVGPTLHSRQTKVCERICL